MIGHITAPALDDVPATFSYRIVTGLLREELGFDGVVVTDALSMGAVAGVTDGEIAVKALLAGADLLLMPGNLEEAAAGVEAALEEGTLTWERLDQSVLRILELKIRKNILS